MQLDEIRSLCLSFPGSTEDVKWDHHLCFSIGGKVYIFTEFEPPFHSSIKVLPDEFEELTSRPGIQSSPYMGRYNWIKIDGFEYLSDSEWRHYLRQSYYLVRVKLPAGVRKKLEALTG